MIRELDTISSDGSGVLPAQMSDGGRCNGDTSGPRALMLAVLEDAVRCIEQGHRRRGVHARRLAVDAEAWVRSDRRDWPFAFASICEVLGFDTNAFRKRILTAGNDAPHARRARVRAPIRIRTVEHPRERKRATSSTDRTGAR